MSVADRSRIDVTQLLAVGFAWLVSRGLALIAVWARIPFYWEVFEAKKLWAYGFLHRAGALVNIQYLPGHLSNPEAFNYVNHPYPIMWIFALAYRILGPWGMILIVLGVGLASCLSIYVIFRRSFASRPAFFATLLYTLAPSAILFGVDTNLVALGAVIWPAAMLIISHPNPGDRDRSRLALPLGIVVFLCGQISWFVFSTLPALMAITAQSDISLLRQILRPWRNRLWLAIILGGALSLALFILQVVLYSPNLSTSLAYAFAHTGSQGGFLSSRIKMALFVAAKVFLLVGPALIAGAFCGLVSLKKIETKSALIRGVLVALGCVVVAALALIRFYYRERTPYAYLLFPTAVLTASALENARAWLYAGLSILVVLGLAYVCLQLSSPIMSSAGRSVTAFLQQTTGPDDVVMSNLREQQPPFPSWDTGSREITMFTADRLLYYNIETAWQLKERKSAFQSQQHLPRYLFLCDSARPISSDLEQVIQQSGHLVVRQSLPIPREVESVALKLRSFYWRIVGSPFAQDNVSNPAERGKIEFALYQIDGP